MVFCGGIPKRSDAPIPPGKSPECTYSHPAYRAGIIPRMPIPSTIGHAIERIAKQGSLRAQPLG